MKKYIIICLGLLIFISCKKSGMKTFEVVKVWEKPEERLSTLKNILQSNKSGWEYLIEYSAHKTISYGFLGFNSEKTSEFISDFSKNFSTFQSTDYRLDIVDANASLIFHPNSTFAKFASDAREIDTLFTFKSYHQDTIILEGERFGSLLKLSKCSMEKQQKLKANTMNADIEKMKKLVNLPQYFFHLKKDEKTFAVEIDTSTRTMRFTGGNNLKPIQISSKYYFHGDGIALVKPIQLDGTSIHFIEDITFEQNTLTSKNGVRISNENYPKVYGSSSLKEFVGDETIRLWWLSKDGLCQRNKIDIAGLKKLPEFMDFNIAPYYNYHQEAKVYYWYFSIGLRGFNPGGQEGPLHRVSSDGLLRFLPFLETEPADSEQVVKSMKVIKEYMYNKKGFYVMKTGNGYTLVDARDGLTWIYLEAPTDMS